MTVIETDKVRSAVTTPNHIVLKMLAVSLVLAFSSMMVVFAAS